MVGFAGGSCQPNPVRMRYSRTRAPIGSETSTRQKILMRNNWYVAVSHWNTYVQNVARLRLPRDTPITVAYRVHVVLSCCSDFTVPCV